jgi:hypothetical protein
MFMQQKKTYHVYAVEDYITIACEYHVCVFGVEKKVYNTGVCVRTHVRPIVHGVHLNVVACAECSLVVLRPSVVVKSIANAAATSPSIRPSLHDHCFGGSVHSVGYILYIPSSTPPTFSCSFSCLSRSMSAPSGVGVRDESDVLYTHY